MQAAVLSLGQQIADNLDKRDLLSRWMAHHLADRLVALEAMDIDTRQAAEREVSDLIIQIWTRRQEVGFDKTPLPATDSVARALERLDPERRSPFSYFRPFDEEPGPSEEEIETNAALKLALAVDESAADLIQALIAHAATIAIDHDAGWVRAAEPVDGKLRELRRLMSHLGVNDEDPEPRSLSVEQISKTARALVSIAQRASRLSSSSH
ncbi:hypothetical protein ABID92_002033 [Frigoribacterium sp. PvP120]|uniref:hypothetical protein n=1 Tax=unclassified Frigoribacterium TaxID=2627005 RepID=UPI001AE5B6AD|nr:hypothetical protein [Frigoribacterium sp. PvP121]MBP1240335.1 hypothetical protein [Frigoribacterium sp. PvP121]